MTRPAIQIPDAIRHELEAGAALAISISGGKDSQAMMSALVREYEARPEWTGPVFAIHADLGRAEWHQTGEIVQQQAEAAGLELVVVRREKGDMVDRWRERMEQLAGTDKPFWSSSAARYCTSDLKRNPIDKYLRRFDRVVVAMGLRAEESAARAKKAVCGFRPGINNSRRVATNWNPIHHWTEADVWVEIGTSLDDLEHRRELYRQGVETLALTGWTAHPAYVFGNERLSCALCVLASRNDLVNGARHNPDLFAELLEMERASGCTFQQKLALEELVADVETARAA